MNTPEALEAILKKATANGWENRTFWFREDNGDLMSDLISTADIYGTIFSHEFARAFFGDAFMSLLLPVQEEIGRIGYREKLEPAWKCHLQSMVLEENPISYLEKFL